MKFDFKVTVWERMTVPEELEHMVLQAIKEGKISSSQDVFEFCKGHEIDIQMIYPTVQMDLLENLGYSTIEVTDGKKTLFSDKETFNHKMDGGNTN